MICASPPFASNAVAETFAVFPPAVREILLVLRQRIFAQTQDDPRIGLLQESLKWGQPSYVTQQGKTGTPLRLGQCKSGQPALFVHCQTSVIPNFRTLYEADFTFDGNRAIHFNDLQAARDPRLGQLIHHALTYHLR